MAEYRLLQKRLLLFTLGLAALAVLVAALRFSSTTALSVAIGSIGGFFYLFLLSRSVEKFGGSNKQVGKVQLLVPVILVLLSTRWPLLQLLPALIGFLIYKPAVIISTVFDLTIANRSVNSLPPSSNA
jgi:ATP synthase protein I